ncbi:MAG TPA: alpha/beta hydrolase [Terriglobia bacterium]|nr:alpha/beta hydrolase [Terriglobia bacterium]
MIGVGLVVVLAVLRAFENRFIFLPPRYPDGFPAPGNYPADLEEVWISTEDGICLNAWFRANPASTKVLLWLHGNATNIGRQMDELQAYSRLGVNILALDYRGYGKSEGSPDEAGVYRDGEAAYRYLIGKRGFSPENIIVYGHSLGGAVAVDLASRHSCGGLIVESSFTSMGEMARMMFHLPLTEYLPRSRFDSLAKIARVHAPILIIHGTRDSTVPFSMGQRLFDAAPEPKWFLPVEGGEHNSIYLEGGEKYWRALERFVKGVQPKA